MTRLAKPLIFLAAFYSAIYSTMADAKSYEISVTFATGPGQPDQLVLTHQYCMSDVPDFIGLKEGKAVIAVYTNGGVFSKCGWVHSSATFEAQTSQKEKKMVFEFYKDVYTDPYLKVLWPPNANCYYSENSLYLVCKTL